MHGLVLAWPVCKLAVPFVEAHARTTCTAAPPGLAELVEPDVTYVVELVEEAGPSLVRASYWDFGDWSDLWRGYKHVPADVTFEVCVRVGGYGHLVDSVHG